MRRIFGCLRINSIIPRIPLRINCTRERQGHIYQHAVPTVRLYSSRFSGFMSAQNRWHHARHTADRQRRWGSTWPFPISPFPRSQLPGRYIPAVYDCGSTTGCRDAIDDYIFLLGRGLRPLPRPLPAPHHLTGRNRSHCD